MQLVQLLGSILLGILLSVVTVPGPSTDKSELKPGSDLDRFEMIQDDRFDALLDTATGQFWSRLPDERIWTRHAKLNNAEVADKTTVRRFGFRMVNTKIGWAVVLVFDTTSGKTWHTGRSNTQAGFSEKRLRVKWETYPQPPGTEKSKGTIGHYDLAISNGFEILVDTMTGMCWRHDQHGKVPGWKALNSPIKVGKGEAAKAGSYKLRFIAEPKEKGAGRLLIFDTNAGITWQTRLDNKGERNKPWELITFPPTIPLNVSSSLLAGCLHNGEVYIGATPVRPPGDLSDSPALMKRPYADAVKALPLRHLDYLPCTWGDLWSLHCTEDAFWTSSATVPHQPWLHRFPLALFNKKPKVDQRTDLWDSVQLDPIQSFTAKEVSAFSMDYSSVEDAYKSFALLTHQKLLVFHVWKGKMTAWKGTLPTLTNIPAPESPPIKWESKTPFGESKPVFRREFLLNTRIAEPFMVYQRTLLFPYGIRYYFVTVSGQVHCYPPIRGTPGATECLWNDATLPVHLVLEDSKSGKSFAFAFRKPGSKHKSDMYFCLDGKLAPIPFDAAKIAKWDPVKRLEMAHSYAKFLLREKQITIPKE